MTEREPFWMHPEINEDIREMVPEEVFEKIQEHFEEIIGGFNSIGTAAKELTNALAERYGQYGMTVDSTPPRRFARKLNRWNERNRRRKLKGLPEKPNPYYGSVFFTVTVPVYYNTYDITVETVIQEERDHAEMS